MTYSLFKLPPGERTSSSICYNGGIEGFEEEFKFDHGITFKVDKEFSILIVAINPHAEGNNAKTKEILRVIALKKKLICEYM